MCICLLKKAYRKPLALGRKYYLLQALKKQLKKI